MIFMTFRRPSEKCQLKKEKNSLIAKPTHLFQSTSINSQCPKGKMYKLGIWSEGSYYFVSFYLLFRFVAYRWSISRHVYRELLDGRFAVRSKSLDQNTTGIIIKIGKLLSKCFRCVYDQILRKSSFYLVDECQFDHTIKLQRGRSTFLE